VGLGTPLGVSGAVAHAVAHILYKGLLFMGAGAVVQATGRRRLTELGGLAGRMPATFGLYMIGALSISGAPLLNGFVSKSLVVLAAEQDHRELVAALLTLASVGTFLSVGLKLPFFTFGGESRTGTIGPVPRTMILAMGLSAGLCVLTGVAPGTLYRLLPFPTTYEPYTTDHVLSALQLLVATALGFTLFVRQLGGTPSVTLDADRVYRALGRRVGGLGRGVASGADCLEAAAMAAVGRAPAIAPARRLAAAGYGVLLAVVALGLGVALLSLLR
jgi:multicomponent Na+:H+ antiporter subunit D